MRLKINAKVRRQVNNRLYKEVKAIEDNIPLECIFNILEDNGIIVVDEEKNKWSGFLLGDESRCFFSLMKDGKDIDDSRLFLSWHKFPSGRYEIITMLT